MRMRTTVAVALVVLATTAWTTIGQLTPTDAAPRAQVGMMRVTIHPGSCADAAPAPVVVLNNPAPSGAPDDPTAPLLSYTEAPVALSDLLATPHALFVTLGGDVDAALACGDLEDPDQDSTLSVELREQNDSGFAGVALLTTAGETSRISVILAETPPAPPATTSPTPGPGATAPRATPEPAPGTAIPDETPVGIPIPGLTPVAQTPVAETPTSGEAPGSPYTSEQFGYSIAFDPPWQVVHGPEVDAASDYIVLSNGTSFVDFLGLAEGLTAPACMDRLYEQVLLTRPGLRLIVARESSDTDVLMSTPNEASEAWDITYLNDAGQSVSATYYAKCVVLQPGQSVLLTTQEAPRDAYATEAELREELYSGVSLP